MAYARLRKVGGSVMVAIPPVMLDTLRLQATSGVDVSIDDGMFVMKPARPRYTLEELAAEHVASPLTDEDHAWLDDGPIGSEII